MAADSAMLRGESTVHGSQFSDSSTGNRQRTAVAAPDGAACSLTGSAWL
jgi:hypothetical protein